MTSSSSSSTTLRLRRRTGDEIDGSLKNSTGFQCPTHGRYKRTALTHAVMNGAASVASFLLRKGVHPDGADTSGNANLHYACAYGWYHCPKLLVDAGADVNAANEWRLTPVKFLVAVWRYEIKATVR